MGWCFQSPGPSVPLVSHLTQAERFVLVVGEEFEIFQSILDPKEGEENKAIIERNCLHNVIRMME